jgi:predicted phage tail component-like protein
VYLTIIKNNQTIDHRDFGVTCLTFNRDSVNLKNVYEEIEGRDGLILMGTTYGERSLHASFLVQADDHLSFQKIKGQIYDLFATDSEIDIIDSREPDRKWSVKVSNNFSIENVNFRSGKFTVDFISSSPFPKSINSSIQTSNTSSFTINNIGNAIDPRKNRLVITYTGASTNLTITNNTTGDQWQYTGTSASGDSIVLDGIRSYKNGLSIFRYTNRKLITLNPGINSFTLSGSSGTFTVSFDFDYIGELINGEGVITPVVDGGSFTDNQTGTAIDGGGY